MQNRNRRQAGFTLWSLAFLLLFIGFLAFTVLKMFPVYMEDFNVSGALSAMESESKEYVGSMNVHQSVLKRLAVNNVTRVTSDDVSVVRDSDRQTYEIEVDYDVMIPYMGNVSLLLNFNHVVSVRASDYQ